jgi:hypothetical protein
MKRLVNIIVVIILFGCSPKKHSVPSKIKSDSLSLRSKFYFENNQFDSARYCVDQSLLLDSTNFVAYNNRAVLKNKENRPSLEILADFKTSLRLNPGYEIALFSIANYYDEIKDYKNVINACNQYIFQSDVEDVEHIEAINKLSIKAQKYEKLTAGISTSTAVAFYDSISIILKRTKPAQQLFIKQLAKETVNILSNKNSNHKIKYLNSLLDNAIIMNKKEFEYINLLNEIDSTINYKGAMLEYNTILKDAYIGAFKPFLFCVQTKDDLLIRNCIASLKPNIAEIKKAEEKLKKFSVAFKNKYGFTTPHG